MYVRTSVSRGVWRAFFNSNDPLPPTHPSPPPPPPLGEWLWCCGEVKWKSNATDGHFSWINVAARRPARTGFNRTAPAPRDVSVPSLNIQLWLPPPPLMADLMRFPRLASREGGSGTWFLRRTQASCPIAMGRIVSSKRCWGPFVCFAWFRRVTGAYLRKRRFTSSWEIWEFVRYCSLGVPCTRNVETLLSTDFRFSFFPAIYHIYYIILIICVLYLRSVASNKMQWKWSSCLNLAGNLVDCTSPICDFVRKQSSSIVHRSWHVISISSKIPLRHFINFRKKLSFCELFE